MKKRILFLCTGNSIRSQMAEGLANAFHGHELAALSAGSRPSGRVHPLAVKAMGERGIDISGAESKSADRFAAEPFDIVVTVCDSAAADCPRWPAARRILHWSIADPTDTIGDAMPRFREVREELERRIAALVKRSGRSS
jgi:arsenate reductase